MDRIGVVLVENRELVLLMRPTEVYEYVKQRRLKLVGPRVVDFARAMEIKPQQATDLIKGRSPFGSMMMERLNALDREFDLVELVGVMKKGSAGVTDGGI